MSKLFTPDRTGALPLGPSLQAPLTRITADPGDLSGALMTQYYKAQPIGINEAPDLNITDLHTAFRQLGSSQPAS